MDITIEKAVETEAKEILEYLKKAGGETENLTFGSEGLSFTVKEEADYLEKIKNSSDEVVLVAKSNGIIVGDASLTRLPRRMSHRGEIGIGVLKDYWNKGIGSRLLSEIIAFAKENSFDTLDLQVRSDNSAAIHLYEKFGFKKIGTHPDFFRIRGEKIPFDYMFLKIKN